MASTIFILVMNFLAVIGVAVFGYMVTKTERELRDFEKEYYDNLKKKREERYRQRGGQV